jgi:predicted nucleic acid-binding protein
MNFMIDKLFVDTNILIYAYDLDAGAKHKQAAELIRGLWQNGSGVLSTQVLQEFYVNVTQKIVKPVPFAAARGIIDAYRAWQVQVNTVETVLLASEYQERNQLSFWDAMIVAAAVQGGATVLLTEDLNAGQLIEGVQVRNPFRG